jgi:hypothetical protein
MKPELMVPAKDRAAWITFIQSQDEAWRLLSARGNTAFLEASDLDAVQIADFLDRLSNQDKDRSFLARLHYLSQQKLKTFFQDELKQILKSATHTSRVETVISKGCVRGKPIWDKTIYSRMTGRIDKASFITQPLASSFNTPENQLLKLFLSNISQTVDTFIADLGTAAMSQQIIELKGIADATLKQAWMREVDRKYRMSPIMRMGAQRSRVRPYSLVAILEAEFEAVLGETRLEAVLNLLRSGWLKPIKDDDLFEVYVLFVIFSVLKVELGFGLPRNLGLIRRGRKAVAVFHRDTDDTQAEIYFDQTPKEVFKINSFYKTVVDQYDGITAKERRPDITLRFARSDSSQKLLLIECKESEDDQYMRDSVYKGLAYLRDFKNLWIQEDEQKPKVIVVFPKKIKPTPTKLDLEELELVSIEDRSRLAALLSI